MFERKKKLGEVKKSHQQQPFVSIGFVSLNKYVKTKMGGWENFYKVAF